MNRPLWRPPSEGENLILQATSGCSFNRCTFCAMYRDRPFEVLPIEEVFREMDAAARSWPDAHRVFLADGDALTLPTAHLLTLLEGLAERFPRLARVSCYATPANLLKKSLEELVALRQARLTLLYYGMESGYAPLLKKVVKGATPDGMAEGLDKAKEAGMKISATVILGLGGKHLWQEHITETAALLRRAPLTYLSTLQLYLDQSILAEFLAGFDPPFVVQDDHGMLEEQRLLIQKLAPLPQPVIFRSNHASNALALAGNLPRDRERLLAQLDQALRGERALRPAWLRGL